MFVYLFDAILGWIALLCGLHAYIDTGTANDMGMIFILLSTPFTVHFFRMLKEYNHKSHIYNPID